MCIHICSKRWLAPQLRKRRVLSRALAGVSGYTWVGSNEFTIPPYVQIRWRPGGSCCGSSRYAKW